jgi:hypothetical protein
VSVDRLIVTGGASMPVAIINDLVGNSAFFTAVRANRVVISAQNLFCDPTMANQAVWQNTALWRADGGKTGGGSLLSPASTTQSGSYVKDQAATAHLYNVRVDPGRDYAVSAWAQTPDVAHDAGNGVNRIAIFRKWFNASGTIIGTTSSIAHSPGGAAGEWVQLTGVTGAAPANAVYLVIGLYKQSALNAVVRFSDPVVKERVSGELIVDGAITGKHLFVDEAFATKLAAGFAAFDTVLAGSIKATMIDVTDLTVRRLKTSPATNRGVVIQDDEILIYDSSGNLDGRLASVPGSAGAQFSLQELKLGSKMTIKDDLSLPSVWFEYIDDGWSGHLVLGSSGTTLGASSPVDSSEIQQYSWGTVITTGDSTGAQDFRVVSDGVEYASPYSKDASFRILSEWDREPQVNLIRGIGSVKLYTTSASSAELGIRLRDNHASSTDEGFWYLTNSGRLRSVRGGVTRDHPFAIYTGTVSITPSAPNTPSSVVVTWPAGRFTKAPVVQVTAGTGVPGTQVTGVGVTDITTTSCTVWLTRTNTTGTGVQITAIQDTP